MRAFYFCLARKRSVRAIFTNEIESQHFPFAIHTGELSCDIPKKLKKFLIFFEKTLDK